MSAPRVLQPCPFCAHVDLAIDEIWPEVWAVYCNVCKAIGPQSEAGIEQAAELWNERLAQRDACRAAFDEPLNTGDGTYRP